jgi:glycosyltransferase involved in cell wall biosynthesis
MTEACTPLVPGFTVVVPVYNSQDSLLLLINRLEPVLASICDRFEVILVNDCSLDSSWDMILSIIQCRPWVRGINLMRNFGQHNALLCGLRAARYEIACTLDDDLQNPPEEIPKLISRLREGYDVIYGTPERQQHGFLRDVASALTKIALQNAMAAETARKVSAFRVLRTKLRDAFSNHQGPFVSIDVLLTWGTTRFSSVTVRHDERRVGKSGYTVGKLLRHALNMMTGYSTFPLQLASISGFFFTFFGFAVLLYILIRFMLQGSPVAGFPFLASVISIFSGVQLFSLGVIGEYLGRIHYRTMDRPPYVIRESAVHRETQV